MRTFSHNGGLTTNWWNRGGDKMGGKENSKNDLYNFLFRAKHGLVPCSYCKKNKLRKNIQYATASGNIVNNKTYYYLIQLLIRFSIDRFTGNKL